MFPACSFPTMLKLSIGWTEDIACVGDGRECMCRMPIQALCDGADQYSSESPGPQQQAAAAAAPLKCAPGTLRFAAHLGLALCALGLIPAPHDTSAGLRFRAIQVRTRRIMRSFTSAICQQ